MIENLACIAYNGSLIKKNTYYKLKLSPKVSIKETIISSYNPYNHNFNVFNLINCFNCMIMIFAEPH